MNFLLVSLGGATGAIFRYLLGLAVMKRFSSPPFPFAMLVVNILGSLGLGVFYGVYYGAIPLGSYGEPAFLFVGIGYFGAFTTFSTFSTESVQLVQKKAWKPLFCYISLSIIGSVMMFVLGFATMKEL
ncbi:fluoride efflux transporter FluC [Halalkalibacter kiskunsagensis]|uniref:Fluoride-specific ion channel FluC n=1 Tax=Halalkalibacter kiskunsagensis TaxID=1548599 RepID=A0ABV6KGH7_9BACI